MKLFSFVQIATRALVRLKSAGGYADTKAENATLKFSAKEFHLYDQAEELIGRENIY